MIVRGTLGACQLNHLNGYDGVEKRADMSPHVVGEPHRQIKPALTVSAAFRSFRSTDSITYPQAAPPRRPGTMDSLRTTANLELPFGVQAISWALFAPSEPAAARACSVLTRRS